LALPCITIPKLPFTVVRLIMAEAAPTVNPKVPVMSNLVAGLSVPMPTLVDAFGNKTLLPWLFIESGPLDQDWM
jgi:hypothetical protein